VRPAQHAPKLFYGDRFPRIHVYETVAIGTQDRQVTQSSEARLICNGELLPVMDLQHTAAFAAEKPREVNTAALANTAGPFERCLSECTIAASLVGGHFREKAFNR